MLTLAALVLIERHAYRIIRTATLSGLAATVRSLVSAAALSMSIVAAVMRAPRHPVELREFDEPEIAPGRLDQAPYAS